MGKEYTEIDATLAGWINRQQVFFVATAPVDAEGLLNCSPKGLDSFRVLGPRQAGYVDTGGSGIETVAHLKENGRITIMMCAFEGPPKIFRFYGRGTVVEPHDEDFEGLLDKFPPQPAARNIIVVEIERIIDSCGYGVPLLEFKGHRESLPNYFAQQNDAQIREYRTKNNMRSLDGLPGLEPVDR